MQAGLQQDIGSTGREMSSTKAPVPPSTVASLSKDYTDQIIKAGYHLLESVRKILALASNDEENSEL